MGEPTCNQDAETMQAVKFIELMLEPENAAVQSNFIDFARGAGVATAMDCFRRRFRR